MSARFAVAALACAALMGVSAPAQAQTDVWTATLTGKDLGTSQVGCANTTPSARCSDFLSEDEFTYDSTDYAVTDLFVRPSGSLVLGFNADLTTAAQTLTLDVAGTTFAFEDAETKTTAVRIWSNSGLSWSVDDPVVVKLVEPAPTVPGAPVLTATANGETQIDLSWTVPDTGGRALDKYSIDVSTDGGTTWGPQADTSGTITTYSHTGLTAGTTRHYRVAAVNPIGTGAWSNVDSATTDTPTTNTPATGNPFITGLPTPQVGQSLSASVGSINDADGTTNIVISYQWIRVDGATETDITGATTNTYTPVAGDVGKQLKVRASFTDDLGNGEPHQPSDAGGAGGGGEQCARVHRGNQHHAQRGGEHGIEPEHRDRHRGDGRRQRRHAGYTLGGTDSKSFGIHLNTGQLLTQAALDFETTSSYAVTVSVSDGNGGTDSIGVTITVTDVDEQPATPAAPSVGATANVHTSLDVSWTAPGLNGGPAITGYDLQYRPGTSGSFTNGPQNVSGTSAAIAGLAAGTSYQVQVRALNGETPSDWSSVGTGSTLAAATAPEVPRTLTAAPGDGQVVLTWTVPANAVSAILRYEHRYKVTSATNFPATWTSAGTALTATVGSLTNGTPYSFEVRAVNTVGAGTAATTSATPTATTRATDPTLTLDVDPTRVSEAAGSVQICVVPSAPGTQRITVQAATADGTATAPDDYGSHSGTVALQPNQQRACFTVTLVDDATAEGDETFTVTLSNPANATLGTPHVATVTIVDDEIAANVAPTFNEGDSTTRSVAENTAPRTNIGTAIAATDADSGDTLRYTLDGTDFKSFSIHTETGQLLTLAPLDFETKSSYAVTVSVSDGNGGTDSIDVTINVTDETAPPPPPPAPDPPGPPAGLTVTSGDRQVTVDWSAVSGATGYTVQWKSGAEPYAAARQQRVTASRTTISGLTNGTTYTVRVRTRHAGGTSAWSAEAMATPGPPAPVPTLPAVAAGLLALLLVGRGMALIRRRLPGQPT